MAKFYVFHFTEKGRIPKLTPEDMEAMKKALPDILAKTPGLQLNGTMYDPTTGIGICDWDSPTKEAVEGVQKALQIPYDAVVPVEPLIL